MNFKKLVCLTIAFAMAFAPVVGAQDDICGKCKIGPEVLKLETANEQGVCESISYENQDYGTKKWNWGYTDDSQNAKAKLIVKICNCGNNPTSDFRLNNIIGIRMTILTDGVYWTKDPIAIQPFASEKAACEAPVSDPGGIVAVPGIQTSGPAGAPTAFDSALAGPYPTYTPMPNVEYAVAAGAFTTKVKSGSIFLPPVQITDGATIARPGYEAQAIWDKGTIKTAIQKVAGLNIVDHLVTLDRFKAGTGILPKPTNELVDYSYYAANGTSKLTTANVLAPAESNSCTLTSAQKAKVVEVKGAYQIGVLDTEYDLSYWWVDLPLMVKDASETKPGESLQIKIEILNDVAGGVCAQCKTICQCVVTIGVFGNDLRTMYFPYVFTGISPWVTGIVVTNMDAVTVPVANMEATFTLYDSTGKKFTYTKKDFQATVWPFMLDSIVDQFDGTPKAGAGWMKVDTNFTVDGYQFVTDGVYGAGTLPRK